MQREYRKAFNDAFLTNDLYRRYETELSRRTESEYEFRLAESPVFLPPDLREKIERAANEIVEQLSSPALIESMKRAIPPRWDTPNMGALPNFAQVDFAITQNPDGTLEPKLIELQGFPSLTSLEVFQRDVWNDLLNEIPGLEREWTCWFNHDREGFLEWARRTIVGEHDPSEVILMDIDPPSQKTAPDFAATKLLFGVDAVCPTDLIRKGRELWRVMPDGSMKQVKRIYNRVVFDELEQKDLKLPFDYREELDVEWTPHPNWYWVWSKYSVPFLDHPSVPRARFLSDMPHIPDDLTESYVLKPLFSFAGGGVNVEPTRESIDAIPEAERGNWCLQEKIAYAPVLEAADGGGVKVEVRTMFLRPDDEPKLVLCQNLCRLSRGKMLGVDFNKDFTWVGGTVALWPK
jgi:hypothetical protein